jgi:hypothetical protein
MNEARSQSGTMQLLGMVAGLTLAPVMAPAIIWGTVAANLPLALVAVQLIILAMLSNWFSRRMIRHQDPIEDGSQDRTTRSPWGSERSNS